MDLDTKSRLYIYTLSCFPTSQRCILIFLFKWLLTLFLLVIAFFPILIFYHFLKHYNGKTSQHFQNRLWHVALHVLDKVHDKYWVNQIGWRRDILHSIAPLTQRKAKLRKCWVSLSRHISGSKCPILPDMYMQIATYGYYDTRRNS